MLVDSLMHRPVVTIDANATVRAAAEHMQSKRVGCLVVMRGALPVGIVTERDLVFRVVATGRSPETTRIAEIASAPIVSVTPDASVDDAAETMKRLRIKRLVVMRDGVPRGVISVTDIAYASPEANRAMMDAWVKQRWEG
jgi:CBS domain-containing protein